MKLKENFKKIFKYLCDSKYRFSINLKKFNMHKKMSDKKVLENLYYFTFKKNINWDNPQTFNEKLQWLKLHDRNYEYNKMVDKYLVRDYIKNELGEEYLIPLIGVYDNFKEIDFSKLPNQFVIKCNHDSGGLVFCKDKKNFNVKLAKKKINRSLKRNYYYSGREWPYKNVKPKIIIEKYIEDSKFKELRDYKFFCFNGKCEFFKVDFDRQRKHGANYFDINGNILPFGEQACPPNFNKRINLPNTIPKMINLAQKLSKNIYFLRVDFYDVNGKIYFGELTFYPASGFGKFEPEDWDLKIGKKLKLPVKKQKK